MITGIILAAGSSKRMGRQKLLLPFKNSTIIESVIETVKGSESLGEVLVIYQSQEVWNKIKEYDVKAVCNPIAEEGQSTSVIAGIENADPDTKAYMFILGDQPFIRADMIDKMISTWKQNQACIIVPRYKGRNGMPTIFPAIFRQDFMNISGDAGGRGIIQGNSDRVIFADFDDAIAGFDIDTPEDYNNIIKQI